VHNCQIVLSPAALEEGKGSMSSAQISELIANIQGQIYKVAATLKDSLEHGLKREGYATAKR